MIGAPRAALSPTRAGPHRLSLDGCSTMRRAMQIDPFSSIIRPALSGARGAVAAAHPLAAAAGQMVLSAGGNAVDAVIAAQAALAVVAPEACGLGGDGFFLIHTPDGTVTAINGAGPAAAAATGPASDGGASVTVPGLVDAWQVAADRFGRLGLARCLGPAIGLARFGAPAGAGLVTAVTEQRERLLRGGAEGWPILAVRPGQSVEQPELANTLDGIAKGGSAAFYEGTAARHILGAVAAHGGTLAAADLAKSPATVERPLAVPFAGRTVHVQPPMSQGILLAMALRAREGLGRLEPAQVEHAGVEIMGAVFAHRDRVAEGAALLDEPVEISLDRTAGRAGARSYLHTAGVAAADRDGLVVSSLASVFDDFGSGVFVPECGFVLNNRGGGFTAGANAFAPGKRPVHTLAPALVTGGGEVVALSTPGADGQVQTLYQVLCAWLIGGAGLDRAVHGPRWRSEDGKLLLEYGHAARDALLARGHAVVDRAAGDMRFGAITAAGIGDGVPFALPDWRRHTWSGVA